MDFSYDLGIQEVVRVVKKNDYTKICLQLPDGLKPQAKKIVDELKKQTSVDVLLWAGSNFGACDIPLEVKRVGVQAVFNFGHATFL